jgi:uncharacterized protein YeaO (DUF488 family)
LDKEKLTFKHAIINPYQRKEIKHNESSHSLALQRSKYISVEKDTLKNMDRTKKWINSISVNYCLSKDVSHSKNQFLIFKSTFAQKLNHMKTQGHKL